LEFYLLVGGVEVDRNHVWDRRVYILLVVVHLGFVCFALAIFLDVPVMTLVLVVELLVGAMIRRILFVKHIGIMWEVRSSREGNCMVRHIVHLHITVTVLGRVVGNVEVDLDIIRIIVERVDVGGHLHPLVHGHVVHGAVQSTLLALALRSHSI
jgi:hypothetical protein